MARSATPPAEIETPIGSAPAFLDMLAHISRTAAIDRPVLVIGERGTGKELVASRLTYLSRRWDRPFVRLNCAALSESLLDSELFGHEAGAYTGAQRRRTSRFELADGGTLFLDEIATASLAVQEKLLRVVEYGRFERVGGNETVTVDVRLLAATNADLPAMARAGTFRADLLDRLAFDVVLVPPLRERADDILPIAEHFARRMAAELDRPALSGIAPAAAASLLSHDWPGNVRELRNVVERSVARLEPGLRTLDRVVIDPFVPDGRTPPVAASRSQPVAPQIDAPPPVEREPVPLSPDAPGPQGFTARTRAFEVELLMQALTVCRFNQKLAAEHLGLTYHQFRHHLRAHGLTERIRRNAAP